MVEKENKEAALLIEFFEKVEAQSKIGYWQTAGAAILDDAELEKKRCVFCRTTSK